MDILQHLKKIVTAFGVLYHGLYLIDLISVGKIIFNDAKFVLQIWVKVFKNAPSKVCGRQPLKNFTQSILEYLDPYYNFITVQK